MIKLPLLGSIIMGKITINAIMLMSRHCEEKNENAVCYQFIIHKSHGLNSR